MSDGVSGGTWTFVIGTAANATPRYFSNGVYRGVTVTLNASEFYGCPHIEIEPLHHLDAKGRHYCPTGFIQCRVCGALGDEPKPFACTRWEEPWWSRIVNYLKVLYR